MEEARQHPAVSAGEPLRLHIGGKQVKEGWKILNKVGLTGEVLGTYLRDAGFADLQRVNEFGEFDDASSLKLGPTLISLNVVARKPAPGIEGAGGAA